ncbi:MAG: hypothetical protein HY803_06190, partial [candidate division NC10 bacterium]|nr:hypothetical protein [candidate division NC10 bacterium]
MEVRHIAVAGTGMMGPGIAAIFALAGRRATVVSRTPEGAARGVATARSLIAQLAANDLADPDQALRGQVQRLVERYLDLPIALAQKRPDQTGRMVLALQESA